MIHHAPQARRRSGRGRLRLAAMWAVLPCLTALMLLLTPARPASGQVETPNLDDALKARLYGALHYSHMSVEIIEAPIAEVFDALTAALGVPIKGRWTKYPGDWNIDPDAPITLLADDVSALTVLELTIEQAESTDPLTWQIRKGFIEVGSKERLGYPAAVETRLYEIKDLTHEPVYFYRADAPDLGMISQFSQLPYATAVLSEPTKNRKRPEHVVLEMLKGIVETIEPGNWDYGQFQENDDPPPNGQGDAPAAEPGAPNEPNAPSAPVMPAHITGRKIASIRYLDGRLIICAPDYIHRQIDGYPAPVAPEAMTAEQLQTLSRRASTERVQVTLLGPRKGGRDLPSRPATTNDHAGKGTPWDDGTR